MRKGEFLGRNFVGDPEIKWLSDEERINKEIIGYMAGLELLNGFRKIIFWNNQEVENHAIRYSQSYRKYKKTGNKSDAIWASQFEKKKILNKLNNFITILDDLSSKNFLTRNELKNFCFYVANTLLVC